MKSPQVVDGVWFCMGDYDGPDMDFNSILMQGLKLAGSQVVTGKCHIY